MHTKFNAITGRQYKAILLVMLPGLLVSFTQNTVANTESPDSVHISANSIKLESAKRRVLYSGKVRLQHKTLLITGSKAVTTSRDTGSGEVTITGNPVVTRFIDATGKTVHLTSQSLSYDSVSRSLSAVGGVELKSGQDVLTGQKMQYDMRNDQFSIEGGGDAPRISAILNIDTNTSPSTDNKNP